MTAKLLLAGMTVLTIALTLVFLALKLTNYINWSWISVLSPSLIWFGSVYVGVALAVLVVAILASGEDYRE